MSGTEFIIVVVSLFAAVLFASLALWWVIVVRPIWRSRKNAQEIPLYSLLVLQFMCAQVLILGFLGWGIGGLFNFFLPVIIPMGVIQYAISTVFWSALMPSFLWGLAVFCIAALPFFYFRKSRRYLAIMPPMLIGFCVFMVLAEQQSKQDMCKAAARFNITEFERHTLLWSFRNAPRDLQAHLHASFSVGGKNYGWSYRESDFYEIAPSVSPYTRASTFNCSPIPS